MAFLTRVPSAIFEVDAGKHRTQRREERKAKGEY
jgi:hypothetical protein